LNRLDRISDVTVRVKRASAGLEGAAFSKAQKAEQSRIEAECVGSDQEHTRWVVVALYHGGAYWFEPRVNRMVAMHGGATIEALRKVSGAQRIVDEIEAGRKGGG